MRVFSKLLGMGLLVPSYLAQTLMASPSIQNLQISRDHNKGVKVNLRDCRNELVDFAYVSVTGNRFSEIDRPFENGQVFQAFLKEGEGEGGSNSLQLRNSYFSLLVTPDGSLDVKNLSSEGDIGITVPGVARFTSEKPIKARRLLIHALYIINGSQLLVGQFSIGKSILRNHGEIKNLSRSDSLSSGDSGFVSSESEEGAESPCASSWSVCSFEEVGTDSRETDTSGWLQDVPLREPSTKFDSIFRWVSQSDMGSTDIDELAGEDLLVEERDAFLPAPDTQTLVVQKCGGYGGRNSPRNLSAVEADILPRSFPRILVRRSTPSGGNQAISSRSQGAVFQKGNHRFNVLQSAVKTVRTGKRITSPRCPYSSSQGKENPDILWQLEKSGGLTGTLESLGRLSSLEEPKDDATVFPVGEPWSGLLGGALSPSEEGGGLPASESGSQKEDASKSELSLESSHSFLWNWVLLLILMALCGYGGRKFFLAVLR